MSNLINWPQSISVEAILRENSSLTNKRFFTYAAQSLMTENRFVPIDLDKLAVEHGNPLEYIFSGSYTRVTTLPSAEELNIPIRVVVAHYGFHQPTSVQVRGVYNGNTAVLKSIAMRDELVSRSDLSIYRTELPYSSIANHLRSQFQTDTRPLDRRKYVLEVIPIAPTGRVEPRRISLTPLLNARYDQFWESEGATKRSQYSATVSAFVNPTMTEIVKVLDEVGNQVTPQDFYHNDGTLPFAQKTGSHRGHNTGKMLDVRTFGVRDSKYDSFNKDVSIDNVEQMFVTENGIRSKFTDLSDLIKASYYAHEKNNAEATTIKLKTENQCSAENQNSPESCDQASEVTIEKCILSQVALNLIDPTTKEQACIDLRSYVSSFIPLSQISSSHERYRAYILRNRQALLRFKELMTERELPVPMIIYSFGTADAAKRGLAANATVLSQDTIDPEWNVRSLREGTIPFSNSALAAERLSLMTSGSSPIGFPSVPLPQLKDDGKITHLDHYHFESKEPM